MTKLPDWSSYLPHISGLSRHIRSLNHRLTRLLLGREHEELMYWNDYNVSIGEAIHKSSEEESRVTNFIKDHDGFSIDSEKGNGLIFRDLDGVGDSQGTAEQKED